MKKTILALLLFLLASPALADKSVDAEPVTEDGTVWAIRVTHDGPWRSMGGTRQTQKSAGKHLAKKTRELCRDEGFAFYRFATFRDRRADETLAAAWEDLGGGQDTGARSSFGLAMLSNAADLEEPWKSCRK